MNKMRLPTSRRTSPAAVLLPTAQVIKASGSLVALALLATAAHQAHAQVTLKPDGQWRYLFTAGANYSSGNTSASALNLSLEGAHVTDDDKFVFKLGANTAHNAGAKTAERYLANAQYNRNLSGQWFGFGSGDFLRDELANLSSRTTLASGVGYHLIANDRNTFDLTGGLAYTQDNYVTPALVSGSLRDSYGRAEAVLGEESNHKLTDTTTLRQKFTLFPNLQDTGERRATLDAQVSVAMTKTLNLTAGLQVRYNSDPGVGIKSTDTALVTGVSWRFD